MDGEKWPSPSESPSVSRSASESPSVYQSAASVSPSGKKAPSAADVIGVFVLLALIAVVVIAGIGLAFGLFIRAMRWGAGF